MLIRVCFSNEMKVSFAGSLLTNWKAKPQFETMSPTCGILKILRAHKQVLIHHAQYVFYFVCTYSLYFLRDFACCDK